MCEAAIQRSVTMTNTMIVPPSVLTHKTKMTIHINKKSSTLLPHLPDIVNDCEQQVQRHVLNSTSDHNNTTITCKQIAHSLRLVADQIDGKYRQVRISMNNFILYCD